MAAASHGGRWRQWLGTTARRRERVIRTRAIHTSIRATATIRSYPGRGYSTYHLPHGYHSARYYGSPYYYHGGSWYRPYGPRYVVVAPPIGIGISVLPPFYSTVWFGGSPYYYADDTYYTYRPERREYVVTEPPRGEVKVEPAQGGSDEVFVYPKEGQSEEQQATDRNRVPSMGSGPHRVRSCAARGQRGGDGHDLEAGRLSTRRTACLEGQGLYRSIESLHFAIEAE